MKYRDNVQALCDKMSLSHPIEDEVFVSGIALEIDGTNWEIPGSEDNLEERMFFHYHCLVGDENSNEWGEGAALFELARSHFDELWDVADNEESSLIALLKKADKLYVRLKAID